MEPARTAKTPPDLPPPAAPPLAALLKRGRPLVMGILNVTPDSFSDGGQYLDPKRAIAHAEEMAAQGADILDIGAESTRPYDGMRPVTAADEMERLKPVLPAGALETPSPNDTKAAA